jgi:hypothetical protein
MTMQILELSGLFLGDVIGGTTANPQGQKENRHIINNIQKAHFKKFNFDPMGQKPLPPARWYEPDPKRRERVLELMKAQGLKEGVLWGFKDSKATLDWRCWNKAFPNAVWIVTERKDEDVIKSCLRTSFMKKYKDAKGWQYWINEHKIRFNDMFKNIERIYKLNTDDVVNFKFDKLEQIIKEIGLTWNYEKTRAQIKPIH